MGTSQSRMQMFLFSAHSIWSGFFHLTYSKQKYMKKGDQKASSGWLKKSAEYKLAGSPMQTAHQHNLALILNQNDWITLQYQTVSIHYRICLKQDGASRE